jgi:sulfur relay (sulfurtransferase) DsrF/TusC family protein
MARRVVSVIGSAPQALRPSDPVLEANAYAVAEDIDLELVLRNDGVGLALAAGGAPPAQLAGVDLRPGVPGQDLRALLESGIGVHVDAAALAPRGLSAEDLVGGVTVAAPEDLTELLRTADAVLIW